MAAAAQHSDRRQTPGAFLVRTPVSVSSVRGTEFRTAFDAPSGKAATEVIHGVVDVAVTEGVTAALLEPGQGAAVAEPEISERLD